MIMSQVLYLSCSCSTFPYSQLLSQHGRVINSDTRRLDLHRSFHKEKYFVLLLKKNGIENLSFFLLGKSLGVFRRIFATTGRCL